MPELIFTRDGSDVIRTTLTEAVRIGRHPDNDLTLPHDSVSRFHCVIEPRTDGFHLIDKSRNGTFVNGKKVTEAKLKEKDMILIGPWSIRFLMGEAWADRETVIDKKSQLPETFCGMVGKSDRICEVFRLIEKLAALETPVLILGETGSGKELVARALHELSPRAKGPWVVLNCGAISPQLIESELFGHERGAFTGAAERHAGAFEQARGGTLFLDEIGELPLSLQPKFLRVLEDGSFRRVGGREELRSEARLLAATHRDLRQEVREGRFREDLYFRLETVPVRIPPLRERREDIPLLVDFFLRGFQTKEAKSFSPGAIRKLQGQPWKGNIRELKNSVMRAFLMSNRSEVGEKDLSLPSTAKGSQEGSSLALGDVERSAIERALKEHSWNKKRSADALGISKSTLYQKIREYGIKEES